jgi:hypothetical protein
MQPPPQLDDADVLEWAWSDVPFGHICDTNGENGIAVHGLAICRYRDGGPFYNFACDHTWEVIGDIDYTSAQEAKECQPYRDEPARWQSRQ